MPRAYRTVVITPSTTRDLTTLDTVKAELGVTDNAQDDFLQMKIRQASDAIASSCNRDFAQETLEDYFALDLTCRNGDPLILSRVPVTSVVSVLDGTSPISASDYEFDEQTGMLWRMTSNIRSNWNWFGGRIVVRFIGGFELLPTLPFDLEQACISLVRTSWFSRTRDPAVRSESVPDVVAYSYAIGDVGIGKGGMPPEVENLIAPYRRPGAA